MSSPLTRETLIKVLKDAMERTGKKAEGVCREAGPPVTRDTLRDFFRGKTYMLRGDKMRAIFRVLGLDESGIVDENKVPLVGYVGAGGEVYTIDDHALGEGLEMIEAPAEAVEQGAVAARIKGNSMYPAYKDGEVIYWIRECDFDPSFINHDCIVELQNGRTLLKILQKGSVPDRFTLASYNEPPIMDAAIKWACPVKWTKKF